MTWRAPDERCRLTAGEDVPCRRRFVHRVPMVAAVLGVLCVGFAGFSAGAATVRTGVARSAPLQVVAAENTWGSLASQLGGTHVHVLSILTDPNADPHEYESNPADARAMAGAQLVVVNGAGYDDWARQMLAAQPEPHRVVLDVATLLGKKDGDNPHFWYSPSFVTRVMDRITAAYQSLDPAHASFYATRRVAVQAAFAPYRAKIASIAARFGGTRVASTESIVVYLAGSLGLDLVTARSFMDAVAEGNDPPTSSVAAFYRQIRQRAFRVLVYNVQTVTPLTTDLRRAANTARIPVVGVSETIDPPDATFERWMDRQLDRVAAALGAERGQP